MFKLIPKSLKTSKHKPDLQSRRSHRPDICRLIGPPSNSGRAFSTSRKGSQWLFWVIAIIFLPAALIPSRQIANPRFALRLWQFDPSVRRSISVARKPDRFCKSPQRDFTHLIQALINLAEYLVGRLHLLKIPL